MKFESYRKKLLIRLSEALNDRFKELCVKAFFNSKYVPGKKIRWKNLIYEKRLMPQGSCGKNLIA